MKQEKRDGHDMRQLGGTVHLVDDWTFPIALSWTLASAAMGVGQAAIGLAQWRADRRAKYVPPPVNEVVMDAYGKPISENRLDYKQAQALASMTYGDDPEPEPEMVATPEPPKTHPGMVLAFPSLRPRRR